MQRRQGFTLIEVMVVSGLMAMLVMLISAVWGLFWPLAQEVIVRGQLIQEVEIAVAAMSRDLGGNQTNSSPEYTVQTGQFLAWKADASNTQLWLYFDSPTNPDYTIADDWESPGDHMVVIYYLDTENPEYDMDNNPVYPLIRKTIHNGAITKVIVARNLQSLAVTRTASNIMTIDLAFRSRYKFQSKSGAAKTRSFLTRTCTLKAKSPLPAT
jgi:prepilin-type N-terminal cleavage/methylation domain-containing protein